MVTSPTRAPFASVISKMSGAPLVERARLYKCSWRWRLRSLDQIGTYLPDIQAGRVVVINPDNPEPQTAGPTVWLDEPQPSWDEPAPSVQ
jgi:hypothetical protein